MILCEGGVERNCCAERAGEAVVLLTVRNGYGVLDRHILNGDGCIAGDSVGSKIDLLTLYLVYGSEVILCEGGVEGNKRTCRAGEAVALLAVRNGYGVLDCRVLKREGNILSRHSVGFKIHCVAADIQRYVVAGLLCLSRNGDLVALCDINSNVDTVTREGCAVRRTCNPLSGRINNAVCFHERLIQLRLTGNEVVPADESCRVAVKVAEKIGRLDCGCIDGRAEGHINRTVGMVFRTFCSLKCCLEGDRVEVRYILNGDLKVAFREVNLGDINHIAVKSVLRGVVIQREAGVANHVAEVALNFLQNVAFRINKGCRVLGVLILNTNFDVFIRHLEGVKIKQSTVIVQNRGLAGNLQILGHRDLIALEEVKNNIPDAADEGNLVGISHRLDIDCDVLIAEDKVCKINDLAVYPKGVVVICLCEVSRSLNGSALKTSENNGGLTVREGCGADLNALDLRDISRAAFLPDLSLCRSVSADIETLIQCMLLGDIGNVGACCLEDTDDNCLSSQIGGPLGVRNGIIPLIFKQNVVCKILRNLKDIVVCNLTHLGIRVNAIAVVDLGNGLKADKVVVNQGHMTCFAAIVGLEIYAVEGRILVERVDFVDKHVFLSKPVRGRVLEVVAVNVTPTVFVLAMETRKLTHDNVVVVQAVVCLAVLGGDRNRAAVQVEGTAIALASHDIGHIVVSKLQIVAVEGTAVDDLVSARCGSSPAETEGECTPRSANDCVADHLCTCNVARHDGCARCVKRTGLVDVVVRDGDVLDVLDLILDDIAVCIQLGIAFCIVNDLGVACKVNCGSTEVLEAGGIDNDVGSITRDGNTCAKHIVYGNVRNHEVVEVSTEDRGVLDPTHAGRALILMQERRAGSLAEVDTVLCGEIVTVNTRDRQVADRDVLDVLEDEYVFKSSVGQRGCLRETVVVKLTGNAIIVIAVGSGSKCHGVCDPANLAVNLGALGTSAELTVRNVCKHKSLILFINNNVVDVRYGQLPSPSVVELGVGVLSEVINVEHFSRKSEHCPNCLVEVLGIKAPVVGRKTVHTVVCFVDVAVAVGVVSLNRIEHVALGIDDVEVIDDGGLVAVRACNIHKLAVCIKCAEVRIAFGTVCILDLCDLHVTVTCSILKNLVVSDLGLGGQNGGITNTDHVEAVSVGEDIICRQFQFLGHSVGALSKADGHCLTSGLCEVSLCRCKCFTNGLVSSLFGQTVVLVVAAFGIDIDGKVIGKRYACGVAASIKNCAENRGIHVGVLGHDVAVECVDKVVSSIQDGDLVRAVQSCVGVYDVVFIALRYGHVTADDHTCSVVSRIISRDSSGVIITLRACGLVVKLGAALAANDDVLNVFVLECYVLKGVVLTAGSNECTVGYGIIIVDEQVVSFLVDLEDNAIAGSGCKDRSIALKRDDSARKDLCTAACVEVVQSLNLYNILVITDSCKYACNVVLGSFIQTCEGINLDLIVSCLINKAVDEQFLSAQHTVIYTNCIYSCGHDVEEGEASAILGARALCLVSSHAVVVCLGYGCVKRRIRTVVIGDLEVDVRVVGSLGDLHGAGCCDHPIRAHVEPAGVIQVVDGSCRVRSSRSGPEEGVLCRPATARVSDVGECPTVAQGCAAAAMQGAKAKRSQNAEAEVVTSADIGLTGIKQTLAVCGGNTVNGCKYFRREVVEVLVAVAQRETVLHLCLCICMVVSNDSVADTVELFAPSAVQRCIAVSLSLFTRRLVRPDTVHYVNRRITYEGGVETDEAVLYVQCVVVRGRYIGSFIKDLIDGCLVGCLVLDLLKAGRHDRSVCKQADELVKELVAELAAGVDLIAEIEAVVDRNVDCMVLSIFLSQKHAVVDTDCVEVGRMTLGKQESVRAVHRPGRACLICAGDGSKILLCVIKIRGYVAVDVGRNSRTVKFPIAIDRTVADEAVGCLGVDLSILGSRDRIGANRAVGEEDVRLSKLHGEVHVGRVGVRPVIDRRNDPSVIAASSAAVTPCTVMRICECLEVTDTEHSTICVSAGISVRKLLIVFDISFSRVAVFVKSDIACRIGNVNGLEHCHELDGKVVLGQHFNRKRQVGACVQRSGRGVVEGVVCGSRGINTVSTHLTVEEVVTEGTVGVLEPEGVVVDPRITCTLDTVLPYTACNACGNIGRNERGEVCNETVLYVEVVERRLGDERLDSIVNRQLCNSCLKRIARHHNTRNSSSKACRQVCVSSDLLIELKVIVVEQVNHVVVLDLFLSECFVVNSYRIEVNGKNCGQPEVCTGETCIGILGACSKVTAACRAAPEVFVARVRATCIDVALIEAAVAVEGKECGGNLGLCVYGLIQLDRVGSCNIISMIVVAVDVQAVKVRTVALTAQPAVPVGARPASQRQRPVDRTTGVVGRGIAGARKEVRIAVLVEGERTALEPAEVIDNTPVYRKDLRNTVRLKVSVGFKLIACCISCNTVILICVINVDRLVVCRVVDRKVVVGQLINTEVQASAGVGAEVRRRRRGRFPNAVHDRTVEGVEADGAVFVLEPVLLVTEGCGSTADAIDPGTGFKIKGAGKEGGVESLEVLGCGICRQHFLLLGNCSNCILDLSLLFSLSESIRCDRSSCHDLLCHRIKLSILLDLKRDLNAVIVLLIDEDVVHLLVLGKDLIVNTDDIEVGTVTLGEPEHVRTARQGALCNREVRLHVSCAVRDGGGVGSCRVERLAVLVPIIGCSILVLCILGSRDRISTDFFVGHEGHAALNGISRHFVGSAPAGSAGDGPSGTGAAGAAVVPSTVIVVSKCLEITHTDHCTVEVSAGVCLRHLLTGRVVGLGGIAVCIGNEIARTVGDIVGLILCKILNREVVCGKQADAKVQSRAVGEVVGGAIAIYARGVSTVDHSTVVHVKADRAVGVLGPLILVAEGRICAAYKVSPSTRSEVDRALSEDREERGQMLGICVLTDESIIASLQFSIIIQHDLKLFLQSCALKCVGRNVRCVCNDHVISSCIADKRLGKLKAEVVDNICSAVLGLLSSRQNAVVNTDCVVVDTNAFRHVEADLILVVLEEVLVLVCKALGRQSVTVVQLGHGVVYVMNEGDLCRLLGHHAIRIGRGLVTGHSIGIHIHAGTAGRIECLRSKAVGFAAGRAAPGGTALVTHTGMECVLTLIVGTAGPYVDELQETELINDRARLAVLIGVVTDKHIGGIALSIQLNSILRSEECKILNGIVVLRKDALTEIKCIVSTDIGIRVTGSSCGCKGAFGIHRTVDVVLAYTAVGAGGPDVATLEGCICFAKNTVVPDLVGAARVDKALCLSTERGEEGGKTLGHVQRIRVIELFSKCKISIDLSFKLRLDGSLLKRIGDKACGGHGIEYCGIKRLVCNNICCKLNAVEVDKVDGNVVLLLFERQNLIIDTNGIEVGTETLRQPEQVRIARTHKITLSAREVCLDVRGVGNGGTVVVGGREDSTVLVHHVSSSILIGIALCSRDRISADAHTGRVEILLTLVIGHAHAVGCTPVGGTGDLPLRTRAARAARRVVPDTVIVVGERLEITDTCDRTVEVSAGVFLRHNAARSHEGLDGLVVLVINEIARAVGDIVRSQICKVFQRKVVCGKKLDTKVKARTVGEVVGGTVAACALGVNLVDIGTVVHIVTEGTVIVLSPLILVANGGIAGAEEVSPSTVHKVNSACLEDGKERGHVLGSSILVDIYHVFRDRLDLSEDACSLLCLFKGICYDSLVCNEADHCFSGDSICKHLVGNGDVVVNQNINKTVVKLFFCRQCSVIYTDTEEIGRRVLREIEGSIFVKIVIKVNAAPCLGSGVRKLGGRIHAGREVIGCHSLAVIRYKVAGVSGVTGCLLKVNGSLGIGVVAVVTSIVIALSGALRLVILQAVLAGEVIVALGEDLCRRNVCGRVELCLVVGKSHTVTVDTDLSLSVFVNDRLVKVDTVGGKYAGCRLMEAFTLCVLYKTGVTPTGAGADEALVGTGVVPLRTSKQPVNCAADVVPAGRTVNVLRVSIEPANAVHTLTDRLRDRIIAALIVCGNKRAVYLIINGSVRRALVSIRDQKGSVQCGILNREILIREVCKIEVEVSIIIKEVICGREGSARLACGVSAALDVACPCIKADSAACAGRPDCRIGKACIYKTDKVAPGACREIDRVLSKYAEECGHILGRSIFLNESSLFGSDREICKDVFLGSIHLELIADHTLSSCKNAVSCLHVNSIGKLSLGHGDAIILHGIHSSILHVLFRRQCSVIDTDGIEVGRTLMREVEAGVVRIIRIRNIYIVVRILADVSARRTVCGGVHATGCGSAVIERAVTVKEQVCRGHTVPTLAGHRLVNGNSIGADGVIGLESIALDAKTAECMLTQRANPAAVPRGSAPGLPHERPVHLAAVSLRAFGAPDTHTVGRLRNACKPAKAVHRRIVQVVAYRRGVVVIGLKIVALCIGRDLDGSLRLRRAHITDVERLILCHILYGEAALGEHCKPEVQADGIAQIGACAHRRTVARNVERTLLIHNRALQDIKSERAVCIQLPTGGIAGCCARAIECGNSAPQLIRPGRCGKVKTVIVTIDGKQVYKTILDVQTFVIESLRLILCVCVVSGAARYFFRSCCKRNHRKQHRNQKKHAENAFFHGFFLHIYVYEAHRGHSYIYILTFFSTFVNPFFYLLMIFVENPEKLFQNLCNVLKL